MGNVGQGQASAIVSAVTKYYYFGAKRVAMRGPDDAVVWLHGDHLGSTSLATDAAQAVVSRQLYYPFGRTRWASVASLPTDFQFTGQRIQSKIALYDYHARFYDPYVGRFIQADTIVPSPGNPQHFNRYSYVRNNPLNFTDPSGHKDCGPACEEDEYIPEFDEYYRFTTSDYDMLGIPLQDPWSDPNYSEWFSGRHSGCFLCHAGGGRTPLTNEELAAAERRMQIAGLQSTAVMAISGGLVVGGWALVTLLCSNDGDCTNEAQLVYQGANEWESSGGLRYAGTDYQGLNRVQHVLRHTANDLSREFHGVFTIGRDKVLPLLDQAYATIQTNAPTITMLSERVFRGNLRVTWLVEFAEIIGYEGGWGGAGANNPTMVLLIVLENANEVITAYPYLR